MSGLYPNEHIIEVFGEQVKWPGLGPNGKFTNGSFTDPQIKPSFIPAETLNLLVDNMQKVIEEARLEPNNIEPDQLSRAVQTLSAARGDLASMVEGMGRDLMDVLLGHGIAEMTTQSLRNEAIAEVMYKLRHRLNNNGEIDGSGVADPRGLMLGDYLDGLDLSGCAAPTNGTAPQAWNDTYKNNRIVVSGFNTYKHAGNTENTKNFILFTFRNNIAQGRMNASNTNANGYPASELRAWLEGASGDGSGIFATKLKAALGGNYLYTINKYHSIKSGSAWGNYTVFPPSEIEVFGNQTFGDELNGYNTNVQIPLYQMSAVYRCKRYHGVRSDWWTSTPTFGTGQFCIVFSAGCPTSNPPNESFFVSPVFCIA